LPIKAEGTVEISNYPDKAASDAPLRAWEYRLIRA
jgi:hypothetical protein